MDPVRVRWVDGMQFVGEGGSKHGVIMDAGAGDGGRDSGPRPTELLLMALGGCTGIDIVQILQKSRVVVDRFEMRVAGVRAETFPKKFVRVEVEYLFWGEDIPADKVERAIALSKDKYCSVGATLSGSTRLETRYRIFSSTDGPEAS